MRRKKQHEEHPNHERWLVSYADFITLLFAFFVVMYSVSSVNEGKYRVLSSTLVDAFQQSAKSPNPIQIGEVARTSFPSNSDPFEGVSGHSPVPGELIPAVEVSDSLEANYSSPKPASPPEPAPEPAAEEALEFPLEPLAVDIKQSLAPFIEEGLAEVKQTAYWLEVGIKSKMLFRSGEARLSQEAIKALRDLSAILKPIPNPINVEGHTDDVPISTFAFPSNWELSAARAASVVHLFTRLGIDPQRMAAVGFGEYRPTADNETEEGRQKNRRVTLLIMANTKQEIGRSFPVPPTTEEP